MVFVVGIAAALLLGIGYVLQQRVAASAPLSEMLRIQLLFDLMRRPLWWAGIGCMIIGQLLSGYALQLSSVSLVEPLLSTNLLFALATATLYAGARPRWTEIVGALMVSGALGVFIAVGNPHSTHWTGTPFWAGVIGVGSVAAVVLACTLIGRRRHLVGESVWLAAGAGVLYGLQDASTRGALLTLDHHGVVFMLTRPWAYLVIGSAAVGILLSQSAFKAARLDWSLPPITVTEPVVGIALGIALLGDTMSFTIPGLAAESACLLVMIGGVVLIGRSTSLATAGGCETGRPVHNRPVNWPDAAPELVAEPGPPDSSEDQAGRPGGSHAAPARLPHRREHPDR